MRTKLPLGLVVAGLLAGCQDPGPGTPDAAFAPDAIHLTIGPVELQPGQEDTLCITALLPTTTPIEVVQLDARQTATHHVIFYREAVGAVVNLTPTRCPPLDILSTSRAPLFIGETPQASMHLPPGVAYRLAASAPYRIEGHFLNASPQPAQASAEIVLTPAPAGSTNDEADMLFLSAVSQFDKSYDGQQAGLPPGTVTTLDPAFWGVPDDLVGSRFFALTSHQHHLGTDFTISKSTDAGAPGQPLYETHDWAHPPLLTFPEAAPLTFQRGEGFRWVCTYNNTSQSYVKFGQSAQTNEMCILWSYYYPSQGFRVIFL